MSEFDQVYQRRNTNSVKWDRIAEEYKQSDLLPLWVADMDFKALPALTEAFEEYLKKGIYGYSTFPNSLYEAIISWQNRRYRYSLKKEEILFNSGVVPSIALAVQAYTSEGEAVLIHDPVYTPFANVIKNNNRQLIRNTLKEVNNHFEIDFDEMEQAIVAHNVKLFILSNPHNPGGRVWSLDELQQIGDLCKKHQVIVVSDEIHQDLVFQPNKFTSFQTVDASFADFSIVLTSATKTFNLAGIKNSMAFIKQPELRKKFSAVQTKNAAYEINTFGLIGTEAAYDHGEQWLNELLEYLKENLEFICEFIEEKLPKVSYQKPEGTYLIWLDFSAYNLSDSELEKKMIQEAKVVLNAGRSFGPAGTNHMRLNFACPRTTLAEGLERIASVFSEID